MAIYVSTGAFRSRDLGEIVELALTNRITHLELSSGAAHEPRLDACIERLLANGVSLAVHNYFPAPAEPFVLNLGALDPSVRERSKRHVRECIDLCARLHLPYYSLHAAYGLPVRAQDLGNPQAQVALAERDGLPARDEVYGVFVDAVREMAAYGSARDVDLLIENNALSVPYMEARKADPFLLTTAEESERFIADAASPHVGLLVDVAHARVSSAALGRDAEDFLRRTLPLARCVHLSDNDGREDQNLPFREDSWFWPLLKPHADRLDFVIEVYNLAPETIRQQLELARTLLYS
ncbi:sugar phosphate isomerase/epimerase family protein [Magnetospirillum aberrantis]|uniref:Sugar phosphate isomerase/epimerase n=1 Tax=Magnetospirillum aberrantis SpK TaxID=908842 RepID=A0A7C9URE9_9PROT|nr:TIM barrel protein [Magnetospirillum aberrantis]NFV78547.1 sugar phosphate isomerase/epimerase [Magnetospirillum aberrantis SpK]